MCKQAEAAKEIYLSGYNCAQAVAGAFETETGMEREALLKIASGFGGGVAGMREICGAVSGMMMVMGLIHGSGEALGREEKDAFNKRLAAMAAEFKSGAGRLRCGDLLAAKAAEIPQREYCSGLVYSAAALAQKNIGNNAGGIGE